MAKNKLNNLNDHLFAQLERLNDENLKGDALQLEINRGKTMASVAAQIVGAGRLILDADAHAREHGLQKAQNPLLRLSAPAPETDDK